MLTDSFGIAVHVRTRRPGKILQVDLPAYLGDGDAATIFVEPLHDGSVRVSDLGHTRMRASYVADVGDAEDENLARLSAKHGFELTDGSLVCVTSTADILPAVMGLAQIESEADVSIARGSMRGIRADEFREIVRQALVEAFSEKCRLDYHEDSDPEGLFAMDALIETERPIGVAIVPNDIEAERAVAARYKMQDALTSKRGSFVAIPKDINRLSNKTRSRLMKAFLVPVPVYEEEKGAGVRSKLEQLAS